MNMKTSGIAEQSQDTDEERELVTGSTPQNCRQSRLTWIKHAVLLVHRNISPP
jgi:hypothetical protein